MFRQNTFNSFLPWKDTDSNDNDSERRACYRSLQTFSDWATHVIRLTDGSPYVEVEWTAGPIPIDTPWLPADVVGSKRFDRWGK